MKLFLSLLYRTDEMLMTLYLHNERKEEINPCIAIEIQADVNFIALRSVFYAKHIHE